MADHELILYEYPTCPFCQKVLRAIDELGVKVELRDTIQNPQHRADLRRMTGSTQVPTLLIDGDPMRESDDIVAWLYGQYGGGRKPPRAARW